MAVHASTNRERWAWYLYDFGNSAYASVVLLAVYSAYFKNQVVGGAEGTRLWGLAVGIAMLVVTLTSPILGAVADFSGAKKRFLFFFTALSCVFTALLFFVQQGDVLTGMLFFILSEIGYRSAQVFYDALLPEIAAAEEIGRISGYGWAVGSAGGIAILLIILPLIMLIEGTGIVRFSFVLTALFFAGFAVFVFLWLRERAQPQRLPAGQSYLTIGFRRLADTFSKIKHYREFVKFLVAFLIYNDGIIMALDFAAILGATLFGLSQQMLIVFVIVIQITNVAGAYVFGLLADARSCKRALLVSLVLMIASVVWLYANQSVLGFFAVGVLAGFAMAGVQSVSRTMVGKISPHGQTAEFYGFLAAAGRTSSFIGPAVYGWLAAVLARHFVAQGQAADTAEHAGLRLALLSIIAFLVVGTLFLLFRVNEAQARKAAQQPVDELAES